MHGWIPTLRVGIVRFNPWMCWNITRPDVVNVVFFTTNFLLFCDNCAHGLAKTTWKGLGEDHVLAHNAWFGWRSAKRFSKILYQYSQTTWNVPKVSVQDCVTWCSQTLKHHGPLLKKHPVLSHTVWTLVTGLGAFSLCNHLSHRPLHLLISHVINM